MDCAFIITLMVTPVIAAILAARYAAWHRNKYWWPNDWPNDAMQDFYKYADCDGRKMDRVITFEQFDKKYLETLISTCHHFTDFGFLLDEGGVYGFTDCPIGFITKADQMKYAKWRRCHPGEKYKSREAMRADGINPLPY